MWVKIDDGAPLHHKQLRAGASACWLWTCGLAYANRHTTDGVIPAEALAALYPVDEWPRARLLKLAEKLVEVRLWESREGGGWVIRGYAEYQREAMRDAVDERREWERTRKAEMRERKKHRSADGVSHRDRGGTGSRDTGGTSPRDNRGTQDAPSRADVSQAPVPSRPVPSTEERGETPPPSRLGTRETLTGADNAEEARTALEGLQKAAVGKADLRGAAGVALALGRLLVAMEATPAETARAGEALADPSAWWRQGNAPKRVTLHDLVGYHGPEGYEGKPLGWLLAHVRAEGAPADPPPPRHIPTDVATLEQRRAIIAASRARRASPTPTVAPVEVTDG